MGLTVDTVGVLLLFSALIALAIFVVLHNRHAAVNRRFGLAVLAIAGWIISISSALSTNNLDTTILLGRFGFAFASAIPFTLLWMFDAFSTTRHHNGTFAPRIVVPATFCVLFLILSLTKFIVAGGTLGSPKNSFIYGPAHRPFGIYFLLCFAFALYRLSITIRVASGLRKLQLRYLLLGILLGGAGAITTNLLIPLLFKTSAYSALGPYFSLLVVSFSAHAIIRYRLMDIRVVIRKGVVYFCTIAASAAVFVAVFELFKRLASYERNSLPLPQALLLALALAIFFQPLRGWLQGSINRYVYRESYDYQRTIREASRRLSTILDLESMLTHLATVVEETFKAERVLVFLTHPATKSFILASTHNTSDSPDLEVPQHIQAESPLASFLQLHGRTLVREEAIRDPDQPFVVAAAASLLQLGGDVCLSLLDDHSLAGLLIIGPKRSGDPYFAEDIELLETLASQASIAIKNAHLYRQVVIANDYVDNILSTMDSGVVAVDKSGTISLFNRAAERLTGMTSLAVAGKSFESLPDSLAQPLKRTLETLTPRYQFEVTILNRDGFPAPLVCSTAPLTSADRQTHGALAVFSDLSRLKELEKEKQRAERLASFGALASGVAHEIKNPLVAIRTFAELLPERYTDVDFREDFSKVVIREIARIDDLVGRLRGIAATAPKQVGPVDMREPVRETLALLRAQLEQTRTRVTCDFLDEVPLVSVEEAQLKQLFLNLFLNSMEAMGTDGNIRIRISKRDIYGSSWILSEVSDTGPGIPEHVRSHIFDPFFTTKPKGSGLGLAICRGIADAHRGTIRAESRSDQIGTTISIEFPAAERSSHQMQQDTVKL